MEAIAVAIIGALATLATALIARRPVSGRPIADERETAYDVLVRQNESLRDQLTATRTLLEASRESEAQALAILASLRRQLGEQR